MTDVVFFEKDGLTYAKGFLNQEGYSFYVLEGYSALFEEKVNALLGDDLQYYVEELDELPGGTRCPPEVPK
jgi:hypothetical protein